MTDLIPPPAENNTFGIPLSEIRGDMRDEILSAIGYEGLHLTLEQRQLLWECGWRPEDILSNYDPDDYAADSPLVEIREGEKEYREEDILAEEAEALGEQFDYDGSILTAQQRRAVFNKYFAIHVKRIGLRSPDYYYDKSQCLSLMETTWPGVAAMLKAEKLKQGYIEPDDLIERLRKLKPSNNFELRKFPHPSMSWKNPTPLNEECLEIYPPTPSWVHQQLYEVSESEQLLGRKSTAQHHHKIRKLAVQRRQEIRNRWASIQSSVELMPLPDLHFLRDMGHTPGGTLLPWYLVKGLIALRNHANEAGDKSYRDELDDAKTRKEEVIDRWKKGSPDSVLVEHTYSIYRTWPANLIHELDEIEREAIRRGRRNYVAYLKDAEKKMQTLVAFWRDCGLVFGTRTPPSLWWQDPKAKIKQLPIPQYLQERLDAINLEYGYDFEKAEKLRMIETSHWIAALINNDSESVLSDTLPSALLEELDIIWQERYWLDHDDTEDEMIARIRRWSKSKQPRHFEGKIHTSSQRRSDIVSGEEEENAHSSMPSNQKKFLHDSSLEVDITVETLLLQEKRAKGTHRRSRKDLATWQSRLRSRKNSVLADSHNIWKDRLRPRCNVTSTSCITASLIHKVIRNPEDIMKQQRGKGPVRRR